MLELQVGDMFYMETEAGFGYGVVPEIWYDLNYDGQKKGGDTPAVFLWWETKSLDGVVASDAVMSSRDGPIYNSHFDLNYLNDIIHKMERGDEVENITQIRKLGINNTEFSKAVLNQARGEDHD